MATTRKTLGQSNPATTTDATLYTVPGATDAVVSTIVICETNGAAATVKVCTSAAGATTTAASRAICWNLAIAANSTTTLTLGITLATGATIIVQDSTGNVTFTAYGQENT